MPGFNINNSADSSLYPSPVKDPLRVHRFVVDEFLGYQSSRNESPLLYVINVDLPAKIKEEFSIKTPAATYKFPKSISYTDLRITFYALPKLVTIIKDIENKIHTTDTGLKDFNSYMDKVVIALYDGIGDYVNTFTFTNAYVSEVNWGALTYTTSDIETVTLTIKFSSYEIKEQS